MRVTAASLSRLLGLAGESLIQSRQLRPLVEALRDVRSRQTLLISSLNALEERTGGEHGHSTALGRELIAQARVRAVSCTQALQEKVEEIEDFARRGEDLSSRMHHEVLTSRMRPLADGLRGFPRMVRDVARQLGKSVEFRIVGENDRSRSRYPRQARRRPLNHLIRNAARPRSLEAARGAAGRRASVRDGDDPARRRSHRAGLLQITLSDDGRGIDLEPLRAKVVARGNLATSRRWPSSWK